MWVGPHGRPSPAAPQLRSRPTCAAAPPAQLIRRRQPGLVCNLWHRPQEEDRRVAQRARLARLYRRGAAGHRRSGHSSHPLFLLEQPHLGARAQPAGAARGRPLGVPQRVARAGLRLVGRQRGQPGHDIDMRVEDLQVPMRGGGGGVSGWVRWVGIGGGACGSSGSFVRARPGLGAEADMWEQAGGGPGQLADGAAHAAPLPAAAAAMGVRPP